ncbi:hypothetical protein [Frankia sp. Cj5]|uniref:hypothetical protein n=1 Tax=Frankia sp. Cj5 TaxID=2880978 RepID=UPI001EF49193|nr:hypothetical protein [Frankia sp. Cj5]
MSQHRVPTERVAAVLAALAGPLGPWAAEERAEQLRRELLDGDPTVSADQILAVVVSRPALPASIPVTWRDIDDEAAELLAELGEHVEVRALLVRSLHDPALRLVAIQALGQLADPDTAPALAALAASEFRAPILTENEVVYLASALGSVGGADALSGIQDLRRRNWPPEVTREVEIALQALLDQ